LIYGK
jgi:hypothetical protein